MKKYQIFIFFTVILVVIGGLFWFAQANIDRPLDAEQLNALGLVQLPFPRVIEGVELLNQEGERFDVSQLTGKWTYAFFGYTNCPDICPVTMNFLEGAFNRLRDTVAERTVNVSRDVCYR